MTITPLLTLKVRGKKDAVLARQRARRVASLLNFDPHEQACIAAGTFVIACQALTLFGKARLCFHVENQQLHIFADHGTEAAQAATNTHSGRISGLLPEPEGKLRYRLVKQLPAQEVPADQLEIAWLVEKVEATAKSGLFDEIVKQNEEMLALLHELRLCRGDLTQKEKKPANPHAA
jgi:hypothetical protein